MITVSVFGNLPRGLTASLVEETVWAVFRKTRRTGRGSLALCFVSETQMRQLNQRYRGKRRSTDVLSFAPEGDFEKSIAGTEREFGDIFISLAYARREARRRSISTNEEVLRLIVHGTLHLLGYDHATEQDEERMFAIQEEIVERFA